MARLYAFVLAHFGIAGAFIAQGLDRRRLVLAAPIALAVSAAVYVLWLGPNVPAGEQLQIVGYTVIITIMLVAAFATKSFAGGTIARVGAVLFYLSDVFLANWRYVSTGRWNAFVCYPLYYTACVLLAWSILNYACTGTSGSRDSESSMSAAGYS
jgi:hypothetical protein